MRERIFGTQMHVSGPQTRHDQRRMGVFGRGIGSGKIINKQTIYNMIIVSEILNTFWNSV